MLSVNIDKFIQFFDRVTQISKIIVISKVLLLTPQFHSSKTRVITTNENILIMIRQMEFKPII